MAFLTNRQDGGPEGGSRVIVWPAIKTAFIAHRSASLRDSTFMYYEFARTVIGEIKCSTTVPAISFRNYGGNSKCLGAIALLEGFCQKIPLSFDIPARTYVEAGAIVQFMFQAFEVGKPLKQDILPFGIKAVQELNWDTSRLKIRKREELDNDLHDLGGIIVAKDLLHLPSGTLVKYNFGTRSPASGDIAYQFFVDTQHMRFREYFALEDGHVSMGRFEEAAVTALHIFSAAREYVDGPQRNQPGVKDMETVMHAMYIEQTQDLQRRIQGAVRAQGSLSADASGNPAVKEHSPVENTGVGLASSSAIAELSQTSTTHSTVVPVTVLPEDSVPSQQVEHQDFGTNTTVMSEHASSTAGQATDVCPAPNSDASNTVEEPVTAVSTEDHQQILAGKSSATSKKNKKKKKKPKQKSKSVDADKESDEEEDEQASSRQIPQHAAEPTEHSDIVHDESVADEEPNTTSVSKGKMREQDEPISQPEVDNDASEITAPTSKKKKKKKKKNKKSRRQRSRSLLDPAVARSDNPHRKVALPPITEEEPEDLANFSNEEEEESDDSSATVRPLPTTSAPEQPMDGNQATGTTSESSSEQAPTTQLAALSLAAEDERPGIRVDAPPCGLFQFDGFHPMLRCQLPECRKMTSCWDEDVKICPACGPESYVRYCTKMCLYEDVQRHFRLVCGRLPVSVPVAPWTIRDSQLPLRPFIRAETIPDTVERHRSALHRAFEQDGDYWIFDDVEELPGGLGATPTREEMDRYRGLGNLIYRVDLGEDNSEGSRKARFRDHIEFALKHGINAPNGLTNCTDAVAMIRLDMLEHGEWDSAMSTYLTMQVGYEWAYRVPVALQHFDEPFPLQFWNPYYHHNYLA